MEKQKLIAVLIIVILLVVVIYFAAFYKACEEVSPPKMGQQDENIIEKDGKLYYCKTFIEMLFG